MACLLFNVLRLSLAKRLTVGKPILRIIGLMNDWMSENSEKYSVALVTAAFRCNRREKNIFIKSATIIINHDESVSYPLQSFVESVFY